jgi:hypothetical protein
VSDHPAIGRRRGLRFQAFNEVVVFVPLHDDDDGIVVKRKSTFVR